MQSRSYLRPLNLTICGKWIISSKTCAICWGQQPLFVCVMIYELLRAFHSAVHHALRFCGTNLRRSSNCTQVFATVSKSAQKRIKEKPNRQQETNNKCDLFPKHITITFSSGIFHPLVLLFCALPPIVRFPFAFISTTALVYISCATMRTHIREIHTTN